MRKENNIDISTLSNPLQSDLSPYNVDKKQNINKNNSSLVNDSQEKEEILKADDFNNLITETSRINIIKNPPNLLKLCTNDDNDELFKIHNENIKLSSELTLEKCKIIKLNS